MHRETILRFFNSSVFVILFASIVCSAGNPIDIWSNQFSGKINFPQFPAIADLDVRNDIGELLNPDYLIDEHHQKFRRVKKVLPQPPFSNEVNFGPTSTFMDFPILFRPKRFLELDLQNSLVKPSLTTSQKVEVSLPTGEENFLRSDFENITAIELKLFQNGVLKALKLICPDVAEKYSIMVDIIEESVRNEIRSASLSHQLSTLVRNRNLLIPIMKRIKKCASTASAINMQRIKKSQKRPALRPNPYLRFKEHLDNKLRQLTKMSQMDVIPSQENTAILFEIILTQLTTCFEDDHLKDELERIGDFLISTIKMKKVKRVGKNATLHQGEIEELLHDVPGCFVLMTHGSKELLRNKTLMY